MPIDYKKYPKDWKQLRASILDRDNHCCKSCGIFNYSVCYWDKDRYQIGGGNGYVEEVAYGELGYKESRIMADLWNEEEGGKNWIVIVLTIAHLNHDITDNSDENLAALCQRCHLKHDQVHHIKNSRITREKKQGIQRLF